MGIQIIDDDRVKQVIKMAKDVRLFDDIIPRDGVYICGGAATALHSAYCNSSINLKEFFSVGKSVGNVTGKLAKQIGDFVGDIDLFFTDEYEYFNELRDFGYICNLAEAPAEFDNGLEQAVQNIDKVTSNVLNMTFSATGREHFYSYLTKNALSARIVRKDLINIDHANMKKQIIFPRSGCKTISDIFNDFDLNICKVAIDLKNERFLVDDNFFSDELYNLAQIRSAPQKFYSFLRTKKYFMRYPTYFTNLDNKKNQINYLLECVMSNYSDFYRHCASENSKGENNRHILWNLTSNTVRVSYSTLPVLVNLYRKLLCDKHNTVYPNINVEIQKEDEYNDYSFANTYNFDRFIEAINFLSSENILCNDWALYYAVSIPEPELQKCAKDFLEKQTTYKKSIT